MSGPCRLTYEITASPLFPSLIGEVRTMKCWGLEQGSAALSRKAMRNGIAVRQVDFKSAPTFPFEYEVFRREGRTRVRNIVNRKSRRDARRWIATANRLFGQTHVYSLLNTRGKSVTFEHARGIMPPGNATPANETTKQVAADPAKFLPDPATKRRLPLIDVGDVIIARHTVTHMGLPFPAECGVKIGANVIAFEEHDILEVVKRPPVAGEKRSVSGVVVTVDFVKDGWATVTPPGAGAAPFVAKLQELGPC